MEIDSKQVTMLTIRDLGASHRLDPIRVTLDDMAPGQGRINIECYGRAWASYWGAIGDRTIAEFFVRCDNDYLIQNLTENLRKTRFSGEALARYARKVICLRRRWRDRDTRINYDSLSREDARELFDDAEDLEHCESQDSCWSRSDLLEQIFCSKEWWYALGSKSEELNPEYDYLSRICNAVREALIAKRATAQKEAP